MSVKTKTTLVKILDNPMDRLKEYCTNQYGTYKRFLYIFVSEAVNEWLDRKELEGKE